MNSSIRTALLVSITLLCCVGCEPTAFEKKIHQALKKRKDGKATEATESKDPLSLRASLDQIRGKKRTTEGTEDKQPDVKFNIVCPKGTKPTGKPPPFGREEWCEKGEYVNKARHGPAITWHDENTIRTEAFYSEGKLSGSVKTYSPEGTLLEVKTYRNGEPDGRWIKWHNDGSKEFDGSIRGQVKLGHWTNYDRAGIKVSEGNFTNGKKGGSWTEYYPSGRVKLRESYKDGKRDGKYVQFAEAGYPLEQGSFKDGKRSGLWRFFHPTGQLKEQGSYERGKKVGLWTSVDVYGREQRTKSFGGSNQPVEQADSGNGFKEL